MRQLVNWLCRLDMNVILIAHEKPLWGIDPKGDRSEIGVTFDCWDKLEYELHLALNIQKRGPERKASVRKSRLLGFQDGSSFTWSYEEFAKLYGKDIIEAKGKTIQLAAPEAVGAVKRLLEIIKVPDDEIEKWFKKAAVTSLDEMTAEQIAKITDHLKAKLK